MDFNTGATSNSTSLGIALPAVSQVGGTLYDEYIGHLAVPIPSLGTWFGLAHYFAMTNNLLLITWYDGNKVMTE